MKYVCKRLAAMVMVLICLAAMLAIPASAKTDLPTVISQAKEGVVKLFCRRLFPRRHTRSRRRRLRLCRGAEGQHARILRHQLACGVRLPGVNITTPSIPTTSGSGSCWITSPSAMSPVSPSESTSVERSMRASPKPAKLSDYAILRAARPVTECKPLPIRSSESVKQGETVVALGCPAVVDDLSATVGSNDITATRGTVARHMVMSAAGHDQRSPSSRRRHLRRQLRRPPDRRKRQRDRPEHLRHCGFLLLRHLQRVRYAGTE